LCKNYVFQIRFVAVVNNKCEGNKLKYLSLKHEKSNMLLFNRQLTAKEACQAGLVTEVLPGGNFWNEVTKRVEDVVDCPLKVSITKAVFRV